MRHSRIYRGIFLGVLLACTVYLIYTIIRDPVGSYGLDYILLALGSNAPDSTCGIGRVRV